MSAQLVPRAVDVAIIGGGPAGAVTGLLLARTGVSVVIVQPRRTNTWTIGEGLPPRCNPVLRRLGLWEPFLADGHCPSYGNAAAWGSDQPVEHSFLFDPDGHGWHLDRQRFDATLAQATADAGAEWCVGMVTHAVEQITSVSRCWRLVIHGQSGVQHALEATVVVDASGRRRWFARKQQVPIQVEDWLVGCAALLTTDGIGDPNTDTLIEAVLGGWWYSAPVPGGQMVVVHMTDGDLGTAPIVRTEAGWTAMVRETAHIYRQIEVGHYRIKAGPRVVPANSSRLENVVGTSWLAVGDAATTCDPLSSQGILMAMVMGERAATVIRNHLVGDRQSFVSYTAFVEQMYTTFLANRAACYAAEPRWTKSPFWRRRFPVDPLSM